MSCSYDKLSTLIDFTNDCAEFCSPLVLSKRFLCTITKEISNPLKALVLGLINFLKVLMSLREEKNKPLFTYML